jgi:apolipoprotein N-acyltransferase
VGGKRNWVMAVIVGFVWSCAFPPLNCLPVAWLTPALLLLVTCAPPKRAFQLGLVAGLAHYFSSLSWLLYIPVSPGNIVGWLALSGYCSIYPALWAAFCWCLFPGDREKPIPKAIQEIQFGRRCTWGLACALGWVGLECLRGWVITGFPWNYLGASQLEFTLLAQLASFTGVLGVSLVVAWVSLGGLFLFWRCKKEKRFQIQWLAELAGPVALLLIAVILGSVQLSKPLPKKTGEIRIALIQPSIPQAVLWDAQVVPWDVGNEKAQHDRFEHLMDLSDRAVEKEPDLLVWPEASLPPLGLLNPSNVVERFSNLEESVRENKIWRVWGADTATNGVPYNSAVLIPPEDEFLRGLEKIKWASYAKRHLVMFGEYVPFSEQLPFLKKLAPVGNFGRGKGPVIFDLGTAKTSTLICFEDVVPKLARRAATEEVDFLLNLTNDGWFGNSHQQWQHARSAAWRAIETRRPLVRCTNNGITCWVDEYGRFRDHVVRLPIFDEKMDENSNSAQKHLELPVHSSGVRMVTVPIRKGPHAATFYQHTGDWLPWGAVLASVGLLAACVWRRKKGSA